MKGDRQILNKISNTIEIYSRILLEILISVLVICVLIQVINRNFIKASVIWTTEIAQLCFVWITFLGASLAVKNDSHFKVSVFADKLFPKKNSEKLAITVYLCMFLVILLVLVQGIKFSIMGLYRTTFTGMFKIFWIYLSIPVGSFLMMIYMLEKFQNIVKVKAKNRHNH